MSLKAFTKLLLGVAYNLRLPQELKDRIAESAKELNRSMNADIVARLEQSIDNNNEYFRMITEL